MISSRGVKSFIRSRRPLRLVTDETESFIIGGGWLYRQFFPIANRLYLTVVDKSFDADIFPGNQLY
jgi:dihydrofolate reductase